MLEPSTPNPKALNLKLQILSRRCGLLAVLARGRIEDLGWENPCGAFAMEDLGSCFRVEG